MKPLGYMRFLSTMPDVVMPQLPASWQMQARQPFRWIVQFYGNDPKLHFEIGRVRNRALEVGLHLESKDKVLNQYLIDGFSRHLFELKDILGPEIEAEPWDRGWAKVYELWPDQPLTPDFQRALGERLVLMINLMQPLLHDLQRSYRGK